MIHPADTPVAEDETVAAVAEEIEEQARDYILKKLAQELKGVAHLLQVMGYKTRQPKRGLVRPRPVAREMSI